jgi:hypothetical protein
MSKKSTRLTRVPAAAIAMGTSPANACKKGSSAVPAATASPIPPRRLPSAACSEMKLTAIDGRVVSSVLYVSATGSSVE